MIGGAAATVGARLRDREAGSGLIGLRWLLRGVILSEAKDLLITAWQQVLRFAQDDN